MRIADIVVAAVPRGGHLINQTDEPAALGPELEPPEPFAIRYERRAPDATVNAGDTRPLVARTVRVARDEVRPVDLADADLLLFVDSLEAFLGAGWLDALETGEGRVEGAFPVDHASFPFAVHVVRADASPDATTVARAVNETRLMTALDRARAQRLRQLRGRVRGLEREVAQLDERRGALEDSLSRAEASRASTEAELMGARAARDQAEAERDAYTERARRAESQLAKARELAREALRRLERSRSAVGFRLGRATKKALSAGPSPARALASWVEGFRGADEILAELRERAAVLGDDPSD